jgi:protein TonB
VIVDKPAAPVASDEQGRSATSRPVTTGSDSSPGSPEGSSTARVAQPGQSIPLVYLDTPHTYPPLAKQRGWEGTVRLEVLVGRQGQVKEVKLRQSSGYPILDRAAMKQVRRWRFRPASVDDQPIETSALIPIVFELN